MIDHKSVPDPIEFSMTAPPPNKTAQRALECLEEIALEKGLDGLSMRDVAKRMGISLAALQYHYASKAQLIEVFIQSKTAEYGAEIDALRSATPAQGESLLQSVVGFAVDETLHQARNGIFSMLEARAQHDPATAEAMNRFVEGYILSARNLILSEHPGIDPAKALTAATLIVTLIEGTTTTTPAAAALGLPPEDLKKALVAAAMGILRS